MDHHKDKLLIHMHIPKSGGTTLSDIIRKQYHRNIVYSGNNIQFIKNKVETSNTLMGHLPFGVHRHFSKPSIYITMMRDPIERIISLYYYIRRTNKHRFYNKVKAMNFDQFLAEKEFEVETFNLQTRYLCGGQSFDLEQAKKNLSTEFLIVGITELFDESVALMKHELGWQNVQYAKRNVTNKRPLKDDLPISTIEKIIEMNTLDIELYKYAKGLLENKLKNI